MSIDFRFHAIEPDYEGEVFELCNAETFNKFITDYRKKDHPALFNDIVECYHNELLESSIIGLYIRKNHSLQFPTFMDVVLICFICKSNLSCSGKYYFDAGSMIFMYNHIKFKHCSQYSRPGIPFQRTNSKWYWSCVSFEKTTDHQYNAIVGLRDKEDFGDDPDDITDQYLSNTMLWCSFCGDEYGTVPSKELIMEHLRRCKVVGDTVCTVESNKS